MRAGPLLLVIGLLLLGGVVWLVVGSRARETAVAGPERRAARAPVEAAGEIERPADEPGLASEPARAPVAAEREAAVEAGAAPAEPSALAATKEVVVSGTIVVVDEAGAEHASEHGRLDVRTWEEKHPQRELAVDVVGGAFSFQIPAGNEIVLDEIHLAEKLALLEGEQRIWKVPADLRLDLRAIWVRPTRVIVRAADSGRELTGIEGLEVVDGRQEMPRSSERLLALGDSPVTLVSTGTGWNALRGFFLRAPGYAWRLVEVDPRAGGERVVELVLGGALEVQVAGTLQASGRPAARSAADDTTFARVRPADRPWWCEAELEIGSAPATLRFESVPPGYKKVGLELGAVYGAEQLVSGEVEVVAGATVSVRLDLDAAPTRELVPLGGTLHVPAAWGVPPSGVWARTTERGPTGRPYVGGAVGPIEGSAELWRWMSDPLEPGTYEIAVQPLSFSVVADVPPGGRTDLRIDVPPPADVEVVVLERASGARAAVDDVNWNVERPEGVQGGSLESAEWREELGVWSFRAPQGWVELQVWDDDYEFVNQRVEALPGTNRFTLELARSCGVVISLVDGDTRLPWPRGLDPHLVALEHEGHERSTAWHDDDVRMAVSEPGRYRIELDEVSGYLPVEDEQVEIPPETFVEHAVQLVRKP